MFGLNRSAGLLSLLSMSQKSKAGNPLHQAATALRELRERHEERHRPSGFNFAFAERVDFLNRAAWDAVAHGGSLFLRREVLRVIEQHGPDNLSPRYAMIYRGETPVAVLAGQIVRVTSKHLHRDEAVSKNGTHYHCRQ